MFGRAVFVSGAVLMALVLLYVGNLHEQFLTSTPRTLVFLGLPAAGLITAVAALWLPDPVRTTSAVVALSAAVAVYGAELYLTFAPADEPGFPGLGAEADRRTKYQVTRDMRAEGRMVYPSVFPAYLLQTGLDGKLYSPISIADKEVLPLGGVPDTLTVLCNETGRYVFFRSDLHGFNNPAAAWRPGRVKVAALGDSFVQGYCVPQSENFVARIGRSFPAALNLGTSGAGPLLMLATLKEYLPALQPPIVLWFFFEGNDIPGNLAVEKRSPMLLRYLEQDNVQNLSRRPAEIGAALRPFVDALLEERVDRVETDAGPLQAAISIVGLANLRQAVRLPSSLGDADYSLLRDILAEARKAVFSWGGRLYVVYLPGFCTAVQACRNERREERLAAIYRRVQALVDALRLPFVDMRAAFRQHRDPRSLFMRRDGGHYGPAGHELVAETVLKEIKATFAGET